MIARALILTGPSGVGKTTIGLRLQQMLREPWLFYPADRVQPRLPDDRSGFTHEDDLRMRQAVLAAARAYIDAGFSMVIEIAMFNEDDRRVGEHAFHGIDLTTIFLSCHRQTLELRLNQRGDSDGGRWARSFYDNVGSSIIDQAHVLPTDDRSPTQLARAVADILHEDIRPDVAGTDAR